MRQHAEGCSLMRLAAQRPLPLDAHAVSCGATDALLSGTMHPLAVTLTAHCQSELDQGAPWRS